MRDRSLLAAGSVLYVALYAVLLHDDSDHAHLVLLAAGLAGHLVLIAVNRRIERRSGLPLAGVLGVAAALQVVAWTTRPTTSDDAYRYVWDARVQLAGTDPYRYAPSSPALRALRDRFLFPPAPCPHPFPGGCTLMNRPTVHTVYPPAAQLAFDAVGLVSGQRGGILPLQIAAGIGVLLVAVAIRRWWHAPVWTVAAWAWSPLVVIEYGNNAHIDWLAVLLSLGALAAASRGQPARSGVLAAAATLTKIYPVLLVPALLRRRPLRVIVAGVVTGVLLYLPHVVTVGTGVIGFLPGYLGQQGYGTGSRLLLIGLLVPHPADTIVGIVVLVVTAVAVYRWGDPARPELGAITMVGVGFLVLTPGYGWYAGLLLALCVISRRWAWLPIAFAPSFLYLIHGQRFWGVRPAQWIYLAAIVLAVGVLVVQRARQRRFVERPSGVPTR